MAVSNEIILKSLANIFFWKVLVCFVSFLYYTTLHYINGSRIPLYERRIKELQECSSKTNSFKQQEITDLTKELEEAYDFIENILDKKLKVEIALESKIETISCLKNELCMIIASFQEQNDKILETETMCSKIQEVLLSNERAAKKIPLIQHIIYKEQNYEDSSSSSHEDEDESSYEDE